MTNTVTVDGQILEYSEFGSGSKVVVLSHAFLMSKRMQEPWARALADKGFRVICVNVLGASVDGKPADIDRYNSEALGAQLIGVLDGLGIDRAVLGGTSIGSNISVEAAVAAPDRVVGLLLEGPFLERGVSTVGYGWSLGLVMFTVGRPLVWLAGLLVRALPTNSSGAAGTALGIVRDLLVQSPARSAAFMRGLTVGRIAPPRHIRKRVAVPTLIMSYTADPAHPAADANGLAADIPGAQVVPVGSLATLRFRPRSVTPAIISFLTEVWGSLDARTDAQL